MKKFFLLCLLGLTFIAFAQGAAQCGLTFYSAPQPPVCTPNGCTAVGSAASRAIVNAAQKIFNSPSASLYELNYDGTCKCTLTLYSKANYKGSWYSTSFNKASGVIFGNKVWKTANKSFKISCTF